MTAPNPAAARRDAEEARARLLAADSAQARRYAMEECCVALEALLAAEPSAPTPLHFVCTDFPGPGNECVFVECEDGTGRSINAGEWVRRPDGLVALVTRVPAPPAPGMDWSGTTGTVMPPAHGTASIVRSDSSPAQPLPTCVNCGSNFFDPAPPPRDAVREAAERLWYSLTPPRSTTDDGMLLVRAEDVEMVLRALDAHRGGGA